MGNEGLAAIITSGGLFTLAAAVVTGVFMWAKHTAESAHSVAQGAEVLLRQLMSQREVDIRTIQRQDLILATILETNQAAQAWMDEVSTILAEHGFDDVPKVPRLITTTSQIVGLIKPDDAPPRSSV